MSTPPDLSEIMSLATSRRAFMGGALVGMSPAAVSASDVSRRATIALASAPVEQGAVFADGAIWHFVWGDLSGRADGMNVVPSDHVSSSRGAWMRQADRTTTSLRSDVGATPNWLSSLTDASPRRPEEFGAVGDGVADDAPAIQRALDAIIKASAAHPDGATRPGVLLLTPGKRYRCQSRITIDRRFHTVFGYATLDFSSWSGVYVQVTGTHTEFGNGYGQSGSLEGQIVIVGARGKLDQTSVGILYDSPIGASATSIRTVGVTVTQCDVAFQIGSRGYNQDFINCKAFNCDVIFDWVRNAQDNDERTSVFGGTFFNSRLFLRHQRDSGGFYAFGCSVDYTEKVADILSGKVQMFGVHLESNRWTDCPIRVTGNSGLFSMHGGWLLMMENKGGASHLFEVAANCRAKLYDVITNNANLLRTPDARTPTTWATGDGRFEMQGTEPAFEYGGFPARLHDTTSALADGSFDEPDIQLDPIWRVTDVNPIRSRDGSDTPLRGEPAHSMTFGRVTSGQMMGSGCLRINKSHGSGSPASMTIIAIPVRGGDKAKGGFCIRTAPDRRGGVSRVVVRGGFAILDGTSLHGVPLIRRFASHGESILTPPSNDYQLVMPGNGASDFAAPAWATHYLVQIDLSLADQASFLVDGRWADRW